MSLASAPSLNLGYTSLGDTGSVAARHEPVNSFVVTSFGETWTDIIGTMDGMENGADTKLLFGTLLADFRTARGLSRRALELASSVPDSYIALIEKGERPPPSPRALNALADAMKLTKEERLLLFERAIADKMLRSVFDYAGYLFMAIAPEEDVERAAARVLQSSDVADAEAALVSIAEDAQHARLRQWQAEQIFRQMTVHLARGEVTAQMAPFAASAMRAQAFGNEAASVVASSESETG